MTRDGLVEENLSDKSTVKLSRRTGDVKMERKSYRGKEEYVESPRSAQPVSYTHLTLPTTERV